MAGNAATGYALCIALAVLVVWLVGRRPPRPSGQVPTDIRSLLDAARQRALLAVGCVAAVFAALATAGLTLRDLVGLPFALAPGLAGAVGLLLYAAAPPRTASLPSAARREASLTPRRPWSYLSLRPAILVLALFALQVAFLVFTGITSSPDESGRYRVIGFRTDDYASAASPYAGWFYAVPLLVVTAILAIVTGVALWRVSSTPALPQAELASVDEGWRRATTRILLTISIAAVLLQFGGTALLSGRSIRNASIEGSGAGWDALGGLFVGAGLLMLIGSVASITLAALWATTLPENVARLRVVNSSASVFAAGERPQ